jgi:hypothetical protein
MIQIHFYLSNAFKTQLLSLAHPVAILHPVLVVLLVVDVLMDPTHYPPILILGFFPGFVLPEYILFKNVHLVQDLLNEQLNHGPYLAALRNPRDIITFCGSSA